MTITIPLKTYMEPQQLTHQTVASEAHWISCFRQLLRCGGMIVMPGATC